ncbi:MAG: Ig-like domain-containing protein, partial [Elusimicrobiota bacterium]
MKKKKEKIKSTLKSGILLTIAIFIISPAFARIITVDINGGADYTVIQNAINAANSGDTIHVKAGIYDENIIMKDEVDLIGEDIETTIIDGKGRTGNVIIIGSYNISSTNCSITGFTIRGSGSYGDNAGIRVQNSQTSVISNNLITGNSDGMRIYGGTPKVINNTISNNRRNGIMVHNGARPAILNNIITSNTSAWPSYASFGWGLSGGATINSRYNNVWDNNNNYSGVTPGIGDISEDPLFVNALNGDYHLRPNSPCIDAGDPDLIQEDGTRSDMGVFSISLPDIDYGFQGRSYERNSDGSIGSELYGVIITFISEDGTVKKTIVTDDYGYYKIPLAEARYIVTATCPGYEAYSSSPGFFVCTGNGYQTGNFFLKKIIQPLSAPANVYCGWSWSSSDHLDRSVSWTKMQDDNVKSYRVYVKTPDSPEYKMEMEVLADFTGSQWIPFEGEYKVLTTPSDGSKINYILRKKGIDHPVGRFEYYVCAVDAGGNEGTPSETVYNAYAGPMEILEVKGNPASVAWAGPLDSESGYINISIYKQPGGYIAGNSTILNNTTVTQAIIENSELIPGSSYYLQIYKQFMDPVNGKTVSLSRQKTAFVLPKRDAEAPRISISVTPDAVRPGEVVTITVNGTDDVDLAAVWWWGIDTADSELNKAHWYSCSGTQASHTWAIDTTNLAPGVYRLGANARDASYPASGEPHQASEGDGIKYAEFVILDTKPDLRIVDVSWTPESPIGEDDFDLAAYFKCEGDGEVNKAFNVSVKINSKPFKDVVLTYNPILSGTGWKVNFGNGSGSERFMKEFYRACAPGENDISVFIDSENDIIESNESNNILNKKILVKDTVSPELVILYPNDKDRIKDIITISVQATDNIGVSNVLFYIDSKLFHTDTDSPYEWKWETHSVGNGEHMVKAVAKDIFGNTTIKSVKVQVENEIPRAYIRVPEDGKRIRGNAVTIMSKATENTSAVQFQYRRIGDDEEWTNITSLDIKKPYSCYWNVSAVENGGYYLRALAYDKYTCSDPNTDYVTVYVDDVNWDIHEDGNPEVNPNMPHRKKEIFSREDGATIEIADGTKAIIPPGINITEGSIEIEILNPDDMSDRLPPEESSLKSAGVFREYEFSDGSRLFNQAITLVLPYPDEDEDGIVDGTDVYAENLRPYWYDEKDDVWVIIAADEINTTHTAQSVKEAGNYISVNVNHFTIFALMAPVPKSNLDGVIVYPNPCKPNSGLDHTHLYFDGLTDAASVAIYTLGGRLVKEITEHEIPGKIKWDILNSNTEKAASGIYL